MRPVLAFFVSRIAFGAGGNEAQSSLCQLPLTPLMSRYFFQSAFVAVALSACAAGGQAQVSPTAAEASAPVPSSRHAEEAQKHRQAHLGRLEERLRVEPETLQRQCRYESDIATSPAAGKVVLSFDDGPEPGQTEQVLKILSQHGLPAVFFHIGDKAQRNPDLVGRVLSNPDWRIGNHSWSHPNFHEISPAEQQLEIMDGEAQVPKSEPVRLFRYPYGNSSCEANALVRAHGYAIVGWHVDSCDWAFEKTGSVDEHEALSCGVATQYRHDFIGHTLSALRARKGGIVLLHETHAWTVQHLDELIRQILAEGFSIVSITDPGFRASLR